ncbi:hypothetical protein J7296_03658 [Nakaseomyces glabratus]|nr:hypothetical protein J7296_03658 [Nakaseomyces glabratus]
MEVIHSVIAPALYSLLVSLPPLLVQSLPSTPHPHPSRHPSVAPSPCPLPPGLPPIPAPSPAPSLLLLLSPLPLPLHSSPSAKNFPLQTRGLPPPLTSAFGHSAQ